MHKAERVIALLGGAVLLAALLSTVTGCAADGSLATSPSNIDPKATFQNGCLYLTGADQAFQAAKPALVAAGKLSTQDIGKEAGIVASAEVTCAAPPANLQLAAITLVGDAAAIYAIIAMPAPAAKFLPPGSAPAVQARAAMRVAE